LSDFTHSSKAAFEIGKNIVYMLDTDRETHITVRNAGRKLILDGELRMSRRRWMYREAAGVAYIGDVIKKLQTVNEPASRLATTRELKADKSAIFALQIFIGPYPLGPALCRRVNDPRHLWTFGEIGRDDIGVFDMSG